ncbi:TPA: suppressor of fused domain protein [Streptococcus suis]|uniref:suppressor of fused domain protein n=1 Tax=Streptococcus suis TaxID=1307 RepID=UPI0037065AB9
MGLFDFFKKKEPVEEPVPMAEQEAVEDDDSAPGWDAITTAFERVYPDQLNPKHYGTISKYILGGTDPLDGISVYDAGDFWHFVSYGLSELYFKESEDSDYSGYGIEFTFKLKKSDASEDDEEEIRCVCGNLQRLARYIFETGNVIFPNQYIYTKQTEGIDVMQTSALTGFVSLADDLVPEIDTPFGKVEFICLVGATDAELKAINNQEKTFEDIASKLGNQLTNYNRQSVV